MTLEEGIKHACEVSRDSNVCEECQKEHEQLASWLEELQSIKCTSDKIFNVDRGSYIDSKTADIWSAYTGYKFDSHTVKVMCELRDTVEKDSMVRSLISGSGNRHILKKNYLPEEDYVYDEIF